MALFIVYVSNDGRDCKRFKRNEDALKWIKQKTKGEKTLTIILTTENPDEAVATTFQK